MPNIKLKDKTGAEKTYQDIKTILVNNDQNGVSTFIEQPTQKMRCFLAGKDQKYFRALSDHSTTSSSEENPSWPIALTTTGDDDIDVFVMGYGKKEGDNNYSFAVVAGSSSSIFTINNATEEISNNVVGLILCFETISSSVINNRTGFSSSKDYQVTKGWNILLGTRTGANKHIEVTSVITSDLVDVYSPIFVNFKLPIAIFDLENFNGTLFINNDIQEVYSKTYTTNATDVVHPPTSQQGFGLLEITTNVSGGSGGSGNYEDREENTDSNGFFNITPSSGYDALSSVYIDIKVTKCYMFSDPNGTMPTYDNGLTNYIVGEIEIILANAISDGSLKNTVLIPLDGFSFILWSDGDQTISETIMDTLMKQLLGPKWQWSAGEVHLTNGWNVGSINREFGSTVMTGYSGQATTRSTLNSTILKPNGYLPYSWGSDLENLDDYARSFFKLVEFKDE